MSICELVLTNLYLCINHKHIRITKGALHMKHRLVLPFLLLSLLTACGGPSEEPIKHTATVFAMDTVMDLNLYGDEAVLSKAENRISELESMLSVTDTASEIWKLNHTGSYPLSEEASDLLGQALTLCRRTDGALDISIYPVVRAWGFTTGSYQVPSDETLSALLEKVDYTKIQYDSTSGTVELPAGMEIDLGSIAKGYTGDQLVKLLRENGVTSALLNLGGNVQALGYKPDGSAWRIAIQNPNGDDHIGILELADKAAITSGGYERYFEQDGTVYWHIIDPATGKPARSGLLSVTIVGNSGALCDGLSTSLFVMGLENAAVIWRMSDDFEAVFIDENGNVTITEGLEDCFSLAEPYAEAGFSVLRRD